MAENENKATTASTQQDVTQTSDAKAEATSTAKASDELSEDDLETVAGGNDVAGGGGAFVGRAPWRR